MAGCSDHLRLRSRAVRSPTVCGPTTRRETPGANACDWLGAGSGWRHGALLAVGDGPGRARAHNAVMGQPADVGDLYP
jgi:hypothetical protein